MSYVHIISESQWVPLLKCHRTVFLLIREYVLLTQVDHTLIGYYIPGSQSTTAGKS